MPAPAQALRPPNPHPNPRRHYGHSIARVKVQQGLAILGEQVDAHTHIYTYVCV